MIPSLQEKGHALAAVFQEDHLVWGQATIDKDRPVFPC